MGKEAAMIVSQHVPDVKLLSPLGQPVSEVNTRSLDIQYTSQMYLVLTTHSSLPQFGNFLRRLNWKTSSKVVLTHAQRQMGGGGVGVEV
jgi:hypothetical protein